MTREPKRVRVITNTDFLRLLDEVKPDNAPRVLEKDGEDVAVVMSPEGYVALAGDAKSKRNRSKLLALAGSWKDVDTDAMVEEIYRERHESPPAQPAEL